MEPLSEDEHDLNALWEVRNRGVKYIKDQVGLKSRDFEDYEDSEDEAEFVTSAHNIDYDGSWVSYANYYLLFLKFLWTCIIVFALFDLDLMLKSALRFFFGFVKQLLKGLPFCFWKFSTLHHGQSCVALIVIEIPIMSGYW